MFGQKATAQPAAKAVPPARPATIPPKPAPATRSTLPPPLPVPQLVRPEHEHRIDEAQATALLFDRLTRAAQRLLFELQVAHPEYVPRLPSAGQIALAGELLLADPAVKIRLALLAGSFREPAPPPALVGMPAPAPAAAAPTGGEEGEEGENPEEGGVGEATGDDAEMPPGASEAAQDAPEPDEAGDAPEPVMERIGRLIGYTTGQKWGPAESLVRHFPEAIRDYWVKVIAQTRAANDLMSTITHTNLDQAERLAQEIDCQPVREDLETRVAEMRAGLPPFEPPVKPTRIARTAPPAVVEQPTRHAPSREPGEA